MVAPSLSVYTMPPKLAGLPVTFSPLMVLSPPSSVPEKLTIGTQSLVRVMSFSSL